MKPEDPWGSWSTTGSGRVLRATYPIDMGQLGALREGTTWALSPRECGPQGSQE